MLSSNPTRATISTGLIALIASAFSFAQGPIDFETIPGGAPSDGLSISTQFLATHGVTFSLSNGNDPVLAQVGPPRTAFQGFGLADDQPAPCVTAGMFFLTDDNIIGANPPDVIITYATPVSATGGIVLDIDGMEEWTIEARDGGGSVIASTILGPNNTLDGSATQWSFSLGAAVIAEIRLHFTGAPGSVGLGFDNFSVSTVPPTTGQPNGSLARLEVNSVGQGTANGPFPISLASTATLVLDWEGPPMAAIALFAGPPNPG